MVAIDLYVHGKMQPIIRCMHDSEGARIVGARFQKVEKANYSICVCISCLGSHNKRPLFSLRSTVLLLMFCHRQFRFLFFFIYFLSASQHRLFQLRVGFASVCADAAALSFFGGGVVVEFEYPSACPAVFAILFSFFFSHRGQ